MSLSPNSDPLMLLCGDGASDSFEPAATTTGSSSRSASPATTSSSGSGSGNGHLSLALGSVSLGNGGISTGSPPINDALLMRNSQNQQLNLNAPDFISRSLQHQQQQQQLSSPDDHQPLDAVLLIRCPLCGDRYQQPKVLACFHTFCKPCLEKLVDSPGRIICPQCHAETQLCTNQGTESLLTDYALANIQDDHERTASSNPAAELAAGDAVVLVEQQQLALDGVSVGQPSCTGCKSKDGAGVAHCYDCSNFLCANCVMAHQYMHCFEGHRVVNLSEIDVSALDLRPVKCLQHKQEALKYFCFTCNIPICKECAATEHVRGAHTYELINEVSQQQLECMQRLLDDARNKQRVFLHVFKGVDTATQRLSTALQKGQHDINETVAVLVQIIDEQRQRALRDLENAYNSKQAALGVIDRKLQQTMEKLTHTIEFTSRLLRHANPTEVLVFKKLLETRLQAILNYNPDLSVVNQFELEFVPNLDACRLAIANTFGYVRQSQDIPLVTKTSVQPISRPNHHGQQTAGNGGPSPPPSSGGTGLSVSQSALSSSLPPSLSLGGGAGNGTGSAGGQQLTHHTSYSNHFPTVLGGHGHQTSSLSPNSGSLMMNGQGGGGHPATHAFSDSNLLTSQKLSGSSQSLGPFSTGGCSDSTYNYEKWSSAGSDMFAAGGSGGHGFVPERLSSGYYGSPPALSEHSSTVFGVDGQPQQIDLQMKISAPFFPPKSQIKRHKMIYHCKFGEFGVMEGQFTEPSGVAVNAQNDIIVADTNNHRIQIFDKEGRYKFQFGECGKRDGQLLYPNRVAVHRQTGDIVVTERSPTHQIQVYNQYGQFMRKFGATVLQHPRGVTVDIKGRIVVVECKVMRVLIFDMYGNVLQKFGCSKYLEFPNGVVTNDKNEIFISDNRAHCVKVFNYEGVYLRQIGGEGLTNYPIGVGINHSGEVLVADNHNNFNLTLFQQDGTLVNALESKVKHAQCFDVALLDDGSVVLASKDYRLYLYRYLQVPSLPM